MANYILEKGVKPSKDTVRVQDYIMAELFVPTPEQGYLERKKVKTDYDYIKNYYSGIESKGTIIIKNTLPVKLNIPTKATEFLTGVQFDLLSYQADLTNHKMITRTSIKEFDTYVYFFHGYYPTVEQLWNYIQTHENIEEFKKQLEDLKAQGTLRHLFKHKTNKELEEKAEQERLSIRRIG